MTLLRHKCTVPGCSKQTSKFADADEWICPKHWSMVHKATRKIHTDIQRAIGGDEQQAILRRVESWRAWDACKNAAIQAAAGL